MDMLTATQAERVATMTPADAACWIAYYLEQNEKALQQELEVAGK